MMSEPKNNQTGTVVSQNDVTVSKLSVPESVPDSLITMYVDYSGPEGIYTLKPIGEGLNPTEFSLSLVEQHSSQIVSGVQEFTWPDNFVVPPSGPGSSDEVYVHYGPAGTPPKRTKVVYEDSHGGK